MEDSKVCSTCKIELPLSSFGKVKERGDKNGLRGSCKECCSKWYRDYYFRNKDKERSRASKAVGKWYQKEGSRQKVLERVNRRRAKKAGSETDGVKYSHIIERDGLWCYLCSSSISKSAVTIDHIEPLVSGGSHTEENLAVACKFCNSSKGAKSLLEYLLWKGGEDVYR